MLYVQLMASFMPYPTDSDNMAVKAMATFGIQLLMIVLVVGISWFSSRHRKEPMRISLVIAMFIICLLSDALLGMLGLEGNGDIQPFIRLRINISDIFANEDNGMAATYIIALSMAVALLLFIIMIIKESESDYFKKKNAVSEYYLEAQKDHYAGLIESNREIRKIKHDMKNHIYCLKELYDSKNYEELGKYLNEIDDAILHADMGVYVGNETADAIIAEKMKKAAEKGIEFKVDGNMGGVTLAAIDICTIFSNIIDNAIEAVEGLDGSYRRISLKIIKNNNFLMICESNPVKNKLEIQDNMITTTKKDRENHGFGIINIKEAAAKYDGECQLELNEGEGGSGYEFMISVMIPIVV